VVTGGDLVCAECGREPRDENAADEWRAYLDVGPRGQEGMESERGGIVMVSPARCGACAWGEHGPN
jgi:hypothetical protein